MTDKTKLLIMAVASAGLVAVSVISGVTMIAVVGVSTMLVAAFPMIKAVRARGRNA